MTTSHQAPRPVVWIPPRTGQLRRSSQQYFLRSIRTKLTDVQWPLEVALIVSNYMGAAFAKVFNECREQ